MKRFTNYLFLSVLLVLLPSMIMAQRTITGKITDSESGEALIAASVAVEGTTTGTTSDVEGNYAITLPEGANVLVFSYTGYGTQKVTVGASNVLDVQMTFGEDFNEVLVVGYGTIKKEDATGSIASVTEEDFNQGAIASAQDLIVGKIAGVSIAPSTGPGGGSGITIRGLSSLSANNQPLVVVDGVPLSGGDAGGSRNFMNIINPNDIASINVLKDASATAIYGSRASGGVIIITTKKGKSGKLRVNYHGNVSVGQVAQQADVLNVIDYRALMTERYGENSTQVALMGDANTNWQSEIYQNAISTDHNVNLSGGVKSLPYRLSLGYTNQNGLLKTDNFQRSTVALNLNPGFLDNTLQFNLNAKAMFNKNQFADGGAIGAAVAFDPTQNPYDEGNDYGGYFTWTNNQGRPNGLAPTNPLALLNLKDDPSTVNRYILNGSVDYRMPFLPELRANLSMGLDNSYGSGQVIVSPQMPYAANDTGSITDYWSRNTNEVLEFYLNYVKETSIGKIDIMGGYSWQHFLFENYDFSRNTSGFKVYSPADTSASEYYLVSLYSRLNYSYKNLLLTFTLRRDGSSRFSPETRFGLFPAAAAAYKIIENKSGTLNNLKVRLGYGVTGQQDIGGNYYPYMPLYVLSQPNAQYQLGNTFYSTYRPNGYDAGIKWEETTTYNFAVDFGLFNNKLDGSIDFYQKNTKDLLNYIPVPTGTNLTNFLTTNIGNMVNKGVEISLNTAPMEIGQVTWELGVNATFQSNKITKLTATDDPNYQGVFTGGIAGGVGNTVQIHSVGHPLYTFFVYEQVYDSLGNPIEGEYEDLNNDGAITPADRYHYQDPAPSAFYGMNARFSYAGFEFSMSARANVGNYVYNNVWSDQTALTRLYHSTNYLLNVNEAATDINFENPEYLSDHFIQKASFFKIDYINLSYQFGDVFGTGSALTAYATLQNALIASSYVGIDPEVGGIDNNIYPRARTVMFGLKANF